MGKSAAKKSEQLQSEAASRFSQLSTSLNAEAAPLRNQVSQYYSNIVKGGPEAYTAIGPQVDFTKQQFMNARRAINNNAPAGGAGPAAQAQLAQGQAQTISGLYRDQINKALEALTGISTADTGEALSATGGVESAGQGLGQLAAARGAAVSGAIGGLAGAVGTYFGLQHK